VTYAGGTLQTVAINNLTIGAPYSLDEEAQTAAAVDYSSDPYPAVVLNHSFVEGWNTVCVPFDMPVTAIHANAVAYSFTGFNSSTKELTFTKSATLSKSIPYVVYVPAAVADPIKLKNVSITSAYSTPSTSAYNGVSFVGSYAKMAAGSLENMWGLTSAGKIAKANASTTMKGFRAYFSGDLANARVAFFGDDEMTTGIKMITVESPAAEGVYNLQGQKVENLKKGGLYIINGKKTLVK
jgi:hypothetical protein